MTLVASVMKFTSKVLDINGNDREALGNICWIITYDLHDNVLINKNIP